MFFNYAVYNFSIRKKEKKVHVVECCTKGILISGGSDVILHIFSYLCNIELISMQLLFERYLLHCTVKSCLGGVVEHAFYLYTDEVKSYFFLKQSQRGFQKVISTNEAFIASNFISCNFTVIVHFYLGSLELMNANNV